MVLYVTNNRAKTLIFRKLGNVWYFVVCMFLQPIPPLTTLTIKVLQVRHPKRNPFLGPFGCFPFPMLKQFAEEANYGGKYFRLPKKEKDNRQ